MIWGCCGSNMASLLPVEIRLKIAPSVQKLLNAIPAALAIIEILEHSKLDSLEAKGNHLADIFARNVVFKGTNSSQTSVMVQTDISPNENLEKLERVA